MKLSSFFRGGLTAISPVLLLLELCAAVPRPQLVVPGIVPADGDGDFQPPLTLFGIKFDVYKTFPIDPEGSRSFLLGWKDDGDDSLTVALKLTRPDDNEWFGFGFNNNLAMLGTRALVIFTRGYNPDPTIFPTNSTLKLDDINVDPLNESPFSDSSSSTVTTTTTTTGGPKPSPVFVPPPRSAGVREISIFSKAPAGGFRVIGVTDPSSKYRNIRAWSHPEDRDTVVLFRVTKAFLNEGLRYPSRSDRGFIFAKGEFGTDEGTAIQRHKYQGVGVFSLPASVTRPSPRLLIAEVPSPTPEVVGSFEALLRPVDNEPAPVNRPIPLPKVFPNLPPFAPLSPTSKTATSWETTATFTSELPLPMVPSPKGKDDSQSPPEILPSAVQIAEGRPSPVLASPVAMERSPPPGLPPAATHGASLTPHRSPEVLPPVVLDKGSPEVLPFAAIIPTKTPEGPDGRKEPSPGDPPEILPTAVEVDKYGTPEALPGPAVLSSPKAKSPAATGVGSVPPRIILGRPLEPGSPLTVPPPPALSDEPTPTVDGLPLPVEGELATPISTPPSILGAPQFPDQEIAADGGSLESPIESPAASPPPLYISFVPPDRRQSPVEEEPSPSPALVVPFAVPPELPTSESAPEPPVFVPAGGQGGPLQPFLSPDIPIGLPPLANPIDPIVPPDYVPSPEASDFVVPTDYVPSPDLFDPVLGGGDAQPSDSLGISILPIIGPLFPPDFPLTALNPVVPSPSPSEDEPAPAAGVDTPVQPFGGLPLPTPAEPFDDVPTPVVNNDASGAATPVPFLGPPVPLPDPTALPFIPFEVPEESTEETVAANVPFLGPPVIPAEPTDAGADAPSPAAEDSTAPPEAPVASPIPSPEPAVAAAAEPSPPPFAPPPGLGEQAAQESSLAAPEVVPWPAGLGLGGGLGIPTPSATDVPNMGGGDAALPAIVGHNEKFVPTFG
ncbi:hypothetical protein HDU96_008260 [Phlyctochytrium bullatum]|nr:hypothetical protein HDU96_008260 [Phlyctochytrium bullatum]